MQTSYCVVQPFFPSNFATKNPCSPSTFITRSPLKPANSFTTSCSSPIKAASIASESLEFNYNSPFSVFPAEACETIGGEACAASMFPEAKLDKPQGSNINTQTLIEEVDREYFDYNSESKSVLRGEACDDLGGEFCEGPYNKLQL